MLSVIYLRLDFWEFHFDGYVVSRFDIFDFRFYRVFLFMIGRAEYTEGVFVYGSRNQSNSQDKEEN